MAAGATIKANSVERVQRGHGLSAAALIGPATFIVLLGLLVPILILFRYSLNRYDPQALLIDTVTAENYIKFVTDPYYRAVLLTTVRVALFCTAACLILGFPLAFVLARTRSRFKNLLVLLIVLPLFVGNAVRAAGWMTLFGNKGMFNSTLISLGIVEHPVEIMFSETAVIIGLISINMPFMVLTLQSVLEGIDRSLDEAALSLGAGPWNAFWRVIWPLALPGIITGTIMTFILAMNAYATPVLLGGPKFKMMAPLVYEQFQLGNWPFGAAASFVLMATTLLLTAITSHWMQRRYWR
ncbi:ABC transporter permease [Agrobacterium rhizogenes]|uniref:ABC transporter permease n=1 Tax=Rhizobium rhizogenes TaxID=359 RepID=UPI00157475E4|nr:ABC transporter permease [Rhizobium rhizogenes]NTH16743.1 ABC transporter permease [Rhizobium rhizogenes]